MVAGKDLGTVHIVRPGKCRQMLCMCLMDTPSHPHSRMPSDVQLKQAEMDCRLDIQYMYKDAYLICVRSSQ
jgi:hypothetical protein